MTCRRWGDVLVFFPLLYALTVIFYFTFLSGSVKLSDVFPWFFYFYCAAVAVSIFFTVKTMLHLFNGNSAGHPALKIFWTILILLVNPIAVPVYRFFLMREQPRI